MEALVCSGLLVGVVACPRPRGGGLEVPNSLINRYRNLFRIAES